MADASTDKPYDFFLHFYDSDNTRAEEILEYLEDPSVGGLKGYIFNRDSETGTKIGNLDFALRNSRLLLVLLSREALKISWFQSFLDTSFSYHLRKNYDIIPIYLEKIEKPSIYRTLYGIDYSSPYFWVKLKTQVSNLKL